LLQQSSSKLSREEFSAPCLVKLKNRMRRLLTALFLVLTTLWSAVPARSYTLQATDGASAAQVRWTNRRITVALSSSLVSPPANIKPGSDVLGAVHRALAHWASAANIRFVEVSSKLESISAPNSGGDSVSLITVAHTPENTVPFAGTNSDSPGRTRIFYTESGQITEADIALNPAQAFSTDGTTGTYDLEAALTHEVGHLLGLEHSAIAGATMQPRQGKNGLYKMAASTSRTLSDDDRAGVRALYGVRGADGKSRFGAVTGTINYAGGAPVYGAHVWAEEMETGRVSASNITLANGTYRIEGLAAGSYRLWVEALDGVVTAGEIASSRGSYVGLGLSQLPPFRTQELGRVKVSAGVSVQLSAQLSSLPVLLNPSFIGINEQLSTIAVPLAAGHTYTLYLGGDGLNTNQLSSSGITVDSPFVSVNPASVARQDFGGSLPVMSFEITVSPNARTGDYSVRLNSNTGEVACLAGALSIEGTETMADELGELLIAPAGAIEMDEPSLVAGSLVTLDGEALSGSFNLYGAESGRTNLSLFAPQPQGAAAVSLTYANGATAYVPLTEMKGARLGFRIPNNAEPGRMLVELMLNGQKVAGTASARIIGAEATLNAQVPSGEVEDKTASPPARAPNPAMED
jgi:hypothetical protein